MTADPARSYVLLDGALATNLFAAGMPQDACPEEYMLDHPELVIHLLREFSEAGSDILYAPTFSANRSMLARFGYGSRVREYNLRLAALAREAAGDSRIAGNLSPTGVPIDLTDPKDFDLLVRIYAEQAAVLNEAGVDLFAIETMLSIPEARAAVLACRNYGKPIFLTMALNAKGELFSGGSAIAALNALEHLGLSAFGFNCSQGPEQIRDAIREVRDFAGIPLIAKPSAGQPNPLIPFQYDISPQMFCASMEEILTAGARMIGGCCGTTPEHISRLREMLDRSHPAEMPPVSRMYPDYDILLSNDQDFFLLENERIELSPPIPCGYDMADDFLEAADEGCNVLRIRVNSPDEAIDFGRNAVLARLPICLSSDSEAALDRSLFLYQGRCMIDSLCDIPEDTLKSIAARYGAVIY